MQESEDTLSLQANLKIVQEYENLFVEDYTEIVLEKLGILLNLVNTLHEDKVGLPGWKIWVEPILFKFSYHIGSFLRLYHGTHLPFKIEGEPLIIFDEPTISVLFRVSPINSSLFLSSLLRMDQVITIIHQNYHNEKLCFCNHLDDALSVLWSLPLIDSRKVHVDLRSLTRRHQYLLRKTGRRLSCGFCHFILVKQEGSFF
jgi:hypothetical protein